MVCPFLDADIGPFLALAEAEGWICGRWEFEFLLRSFPQGCFVCRDGEKTLAYITSVSYGESGWIGNLLVRPDVRKRGLGRTLMERAVSELLSRGVQTIWLTASAQGSGLYRQLGFVEIDEVKRWSRTTNRRAASAATPRDMAPAAFNPVEPAEFDIDPAAELDRVGWGDRRDSLLQVSFARGELYRNSDGFLCCQRWDGGTQIGPWSGMADSQAAELLDGALVNAERKILLDVPSGNRAAAAVLEARGFEVKGSNLLMYLGAKPCYRPETIYALASMGSMG